MGKTDDQTKLADKLRETTGESLIETLASVLIVSLALTMLAGAIVASAKVNAITRDMTTMAEETLNETDDWSIETGLTDTSGRLTVTVSGEAGVSATQEKKIWRYGEEGRGVYVYR